MVEPPARVVDLDDPDPVLLEHAARLLYNGEIVAGPSDTVYGLLALTRSPEALNTLRTCKGRPGPFLVLVSSWEQARSWTSGVPENLWGQLHKVWPGPVTVILPTKPDMPGAEGGKIGLRMPDSIFLRALLEKVAEPLFSTSANRAGRPPALEAKEVGNAFSEGVALILDGGRAGSRIPSTIVDLCGDTPRVLRQGRGDPGPLLDPGQAPS